MPPSGGFLCPLFVLAVCFLLVDVLMVACGRPMWWRHARIWVLRRHNRGIACGGNPRKGHEAL